MQVKEVHESLLYKVAQGSPSHIFAPIVELSVSSTARSNRGSPTMPAEDEESDSGSEEEESSEEEKAAPEKKVDEPKKPVGPLVVVFKAHDSYPEIKKEEKVVYCPICGLPPDFCQYGVSWAKCKPSCIEKFPQYYPELAGINLDEAKDTAAAAAEKGKVKEKPGGKKVREASPHVTVKKLTRGGRKCVTMIVGLDGFGVNLDAAAKKFKKKFACGCAVVKGEAGHPDSVDVQGDIADTGDPVDLICDEFRSVPREKVTIEAGGTKKKGKPK